MPGLFDGTPLERPVTCPRCEKPLGDCKCPRDAAGKITRPQDQRVRVQRERRGSRFVTVISGLDPTANDLPALLRQLRTAHGVGGTLKNNTIELQGDHRDPLVEQLRQMGFPAKASGG